MHHLFIQFFKNILLLFSSTVFVLYLIESLSYISYFNKKITKNKSSHVLSGKYSNDDKNFVGPENFKKLETSLFPVSGISNLQTIYCNENGYLANYLSDRYGFRNKDEIWDKSEIDFLLLGDSYVHGACVMDKDTISGVLMKSGFNTLNLGISGNGPIVNLASLREYLGKKKFKRIVYFHYGGNDWDDLIIEKNNSILGKYVFNKKFNQKLIFKTRELDQIRKQKYIEEKKKYIDNNIKDKFNSRSENNQKDNLFFKILKLKKIRNFLKNKNNFNLLNFRKPNVEDQNLFKYILKEIINTAENMNANLYFVYIPDKNKYFSYNYKYFEKKTTLEIIDDLGIKLIDLEKEKNKIIKNMNEIISGHYNENGYDLITKIILNKISIFENQ